MSNAQKSLAKGSAAPGPVPEGLIRLYSMRFCPFAQRARLVLAAKKIKHEVVNINLKSKPDWFFEKSPMGLVPSLETSDGKIIHDSVIVCDYLDEAFPENKLTPTDPYERAHQKILQKHFNTVTTILYNILDVRNDYLRTVDLKMQFYEEFKRFEVVLAKRNTPYFGGESVSMIDYVIWPFFERLMVFDVEYLDNMPLINAWDQLMLQDPAVMDTWMLPDVLLDFHDLEFEGCLEAADYGLEEAS